MPRLDGTGPNGQGSMTGRGMGNCGTPKGEGGQYYGRGRGGRGLGIGLCRGLGFLLGRGRSIQHGNDIDLLKAQAENLKSRLEELNKIIDSEKNKE